MRWNRHTRIHSDVHRAQHETTGQLIRKAQKFGIWLFLTSNPNYCYVTRRTTCLHSMLFFFFSLKAGTFPLSNSTASPSLPSPTVGHAGAWKKALARFLWFEPGHFRRSEPPGLGAGGQKAAVPAPSSRVQDRTPWQPAATGGTQEF